MQFAPFHPGHPLQGPGMGALSARGGGGLTEDTAKVAGDIHGIA